MVMKVYLQNYTTLLIENSYVKNECLKTRTKAKINTQNLLHSVCGMPNQNCYIEECNVISAGELMYSLIEALAEKQLEEWQKKIVESEAVVIDGFEVASGKYTFQNELLTIFKKMKCPILISTKVPIESRNGFLDELCSFFKNSSVIEI